MGQPVQLVVLGFERDAGSAHPHKIGQSELIAIYIQGGSN